MVWKPPTFAWGLQRGWSECVGEIECQIKRVPYLRSLLCTFSRTLLLRFGFTIILKHEFTILFKNKTHQWSVLMTFLRKHRDRLPLPLPLLSRPLPLRSFPVPEIPSNINNIGINNSCSRHSVVKDPQTTHLLNHAFSSYLHSTGRGMVEVKVTVKFTLE